MHKAIVLGLVLQPLLAAILCAQGNRASITGTILDSSGATVPDTEITAENAGTGQISRAASNRAGVYSLLNLAPGTYSVRFRKAGFRPVERPRVTLDSGGIAQLNAVLVAGSVRQLITVSENAPVLEKETSDIAVNLKGDVVRDLPLNIYGGRVIEAFAVAITPGYSPASNPYSAVINGTQAFTKDVTIDGTSGTAQIQGDAIETGPSMEAIQEVRAETSGSAARNATTDGGVTMFNLKSGTRHFHGTLFGFGHNEFLDANTWDNDHLGQSKPEARFWDFGASAAGPVLRNKTFAFGAFERFTQHDFTLGGFGQASTVPTEAFLNGDFGALLGPALKDKTGNPYINACTGQPVLSGQIFDPATARVVGGQPCSDAFPNNVIPTGVISRTSAKVVALYRQSYRPETSSLLQNDRLPKNNSPAQTPNQGVIKLDHNVSDKSQLSGSWIYNHRPRTLVDSGGVWSANSADGGPLANARDQLVYSHSLRASNSYSIAPNLLNVLSAAYNWYWNGSLPAQSGPDWPLALGFGSTGATNFPSISFGPSVNGFETTSIGNTWQGHYVGATLILGDQMSWSKGRHTITFGVDFRAMEINSHSGSGALDFNFSNVSTGTPSQAYGSQVGFGFASFLLGDVQSASETTPLDLYGRRKAMAVFAQDNFKVKPKLTLNLGLRWDATFRLHEKYGNWANFDLNAIDPNLGIPGAIVYPSNGSDSFEKQQDWKNFGPHVGFAYSPSRRWVVRGSFGILYVPIGIQYYQGVPYGFAPGSRGTNAANQPFNWDGGYPGVFMPGTKTSTPPITMFPVVNVDPRSLHAGYTKDFEAGLEYGLTKNTRVRISYAGNRGHRLQDSGLASNQPSASKFFSLVNSPNFYNYVCDPGSAAANGVPYPYNGFCGPAYAAIAPYPQLALAEDTYWFYPNLYYVGLPLGRSFYDSMIVEVTKRTAGGLTLDFNYALSRQLSDTFTNFGDSYDVANIQDFANLREAAHTLSPYDQKHVVKGYFTYELPFGNEHRWRFESSRLLKALASGWSLNGLVLYACGRPLAFYSSNYYAYPAWAATYVNYNLTGYHGSQFNPSGFSVPTAADPVPAGDVYFPTSVATNPTFGTLGSGPARTDRLRGFGMINEDVSLLKYVRFGNEARYSLSFRVEFYNLFNRHTFGSPSTLLTSPSFGYVTGVSGSPRQGQFGARFQW
jgi:Carboxypeptidase regulatory-like domain/TonB dependent receptor